MLSVFIVAVPGADGEHKRLDNKEHKNTGKEKEIIQTSLLLFFNLSLK